ncbi:MULTISPECIES: anthranilate 1,2-dioxygenase electron transfer component AntC [Vitreoscilla]|uniref:Anthranilate 1,2-dioxygenase electron transfer component AntC n=1 Tax=Vitreoscilla stercoraria TaxID=61 RepID=A0ABY4ECY7_VITST|nr:MULTISPECIES: anthranilate 1,2-dioxygenase electron transfer component AntC [Vitreoscilla]AUZ05390.1 electron transfer subunit of anthranilate 1,2-dioxygenase [Vitreoscilla sp. C1]UOO93302.1 anthranilate 1,2-dioxygenase electron transfer component AntC [Vitreoscilla stercoraria]
MGHAVALNFADGKTFFIQVKHNELLVDAAMRQGIKIPIDCREGVCGTCQGQCESGLYELDYVDEDALSERDLAERKILACQTKVQSNAAFYFDHHSHICHAGDSQKIAAVVKSVQWVSPNTAVLKVDASANGQTLQFLPGQYAHLYVPDTGTYRSYSFAHCPNTDNQLQFLIRILPSGVMSDYLRERCQVGQTILLEAPLGSFYLREAERPLVFVAGGTGLSAFLGMLDDLAAADCALLIHLYYGVNHEQDLCELERLQAYSDRLPNFECHLVVSEGSESWTGKRGYVHAHLPRESLAAAAFDMYLCGPPPMIEAVKTWLDEQGLQDYRLYSEKFVPSNVNTANTESV